VIAISAGNHAQAVAFAAAAEGIDALVVMWDGASAQKIAATRGYGAAVDLHDRLLLVVDTLGELANADVDDNRAVRTSTN